MRIHVPILLAFALMGAGCGDSRQKEAYSSVVLWEQKPDRPLPEVIAAYRKVIQMDPATQWAAFSQQRVDVLEAKQKELKKAEARQLLESSNLYAQPRL